MKGEHTEVCVRMQEKRTGERQSAQENAEHAASSCERMSKREREQRMREKRNFKPGKIACQLVPKK